MASEYYFQKDGEEHGPVAGSELRRMASTGELVPGDLLRKSDMDRWVKASAVKGLFPAAEAVAPTAPAPAAKKPALAKPPAAKPMAANAPSLKPVAPKAQPAGAAVSKPAPKPVASKAPAARAKAPVAIVPETVEDPEPQEVMTKPASKSTPRWVWFAVIGVVVAAAGGGGAYWYIQHQANLGAELNARTPTLSNSLPAEQSTSDPFLADMQSKKPAVRATAFSRELRQGTAEDNRSEIYKLVRATLGEKKFSVAWEDALLLLSKVGSTQDADLLKKMATDSDPDTRCAAISTLMLLSPQDGVPLFAPHAGDMSYSRVIDALNHAGPGCVPAALVMLKTNSPRCRLTALDLLTAYGSKASLDPISTAKAAENDPKLAAQYDSAITEIKARNR